MGSTLDGPAAHSSLGQRRQAASNLPTFNLPPPPNLQLAAQQMGHKFPPLSIGNNVQPPPSVSVGNLLTPPSNSASESGASSANLAPGNQPVLPYTPGFWGSGSTPNGYGTGLTPSWQNSSLYESRPMFSPGPGPMRNSTNSPAAGEPSALPPPPYELNGGHPYQTNMGVSSPPVGGHSGQQHMMNNMLPVRPPSQASPISPPDGVSRPASTTSLYAPMSASHTPQQPQYGFPGSGPVNHSPHGSQGPASRISPPIHQGSMPQIHNQNHFIKPPYPSYSLPAMSGPVRTNIHSPGSQMSLVGAMPAMVPMDFNSGYQHQHQQQQMYGHQRVNSPQQQVANDRPFKCDQCPQSFNRNHDLKRHKRIHLAVKPFPCKHCDKSFSRKDALKRHILVKGCGNASSEAVDAAKSEGSDSINGEISTVATAA